MHSTHLSSSVKKLALKSALQKSVVIFFFCVLMMIMQIEKKNQYYIEIIAYSNVPIMFNFFQGIDILLHL